MILEEKKEEEKKEEGQFNGDQRGRSASGQVVGCSYISGNTTHAFRYSNGVMSDLGALPNGVSSQALAINDFGTVIGSGDDALAGWSPSHDHALIYSNGVMTDLNELIYPGQWKPYLGWTLESATGINNAGQIAGYGFDSLKQRHAFLLTPIP